MRLIRSLAQLRPEDRGCVATIGNFDGVHRGHQALVQQARVRAEALGVPVTVVIFEPQPLEYLQPAAAPARLTRLREKIAVLATTGIARLVVLRFDAQLARLSAVDFVEQILLARLGVRWLLTGEDFRFGYRRAGDAALLRALGARHGFGVEHLPSIHYEDARISSTRIREALARADFAQAAALLGRPYRLHGRVVHGDQRARGMGFPTANIQLHRQVSPLRGVYAVVAHGLPEGPLPGVANIGTRPTVAGAECRLEVHLLDFARDIYRAHLQIEFRHKLRDERRFASLADLAAQIAHDIATARQVLGFQAK